MEAMPRIAEMSDEFEVALDSAKSGLQTENDWPPVLSTVRDLNVLVLTKSFPIEEKLTALQNITMDKLLELQSDIFSGFNIELAVLGNLVAEKACALAESVQTALSGPAWTGPRLEPFPSIRLKPRSFFVWKRKSGFPRHEVSGVQHSWCINEDESESSRACGQLLAGMLYEPFTTEFKNEQGFHAGDITWVCAGQQSAVRFYLEGKATSCSSLDLLIEKFLDKWAKTLADMDDEKFTALKLSAANKLLEEPRNLAMEMRRADQMVSSRRYDPLDDVRFQPPSLSAVLLTQ